MFLFVCLGIPDTFLMVTFWSVIIAQQKATRARAVGTKKKTLPLVFIFTLMKEGDLLIVEKVHICLCIREKFAKEMNIKKKKKL